MASGCGKVLAGGSHVTTDKLFDNPFIPGYLTTARYFDINLAILVAHFNGFVTVFHEFQWYAAAQQGAELEGHVPESPKRETITAKAGLREHRTGAHLDRGSG